MKPMLMKTDGTGIVEPCAYCGRSFELGFPLWPSFSENEPTICPECLEKNYPEFKQLIERPGVCEYGGIMYDNPEPAKTAKDEERVVTRNEREVKIFDTVQALYSAVLELTQETDCLRGSFYEKAKRINDMAGDLVGEVYGYSQDLYGQVIREGVKALRVKGYPFERIKMAGFDFEVTEDGDVCDRSETPF